MVARVVAKSEGWPNSVATGIDSGITNTIADGHLRERLDQIVGPGPYFRERP